MLKNFLTKLLRGKTITIEQSGSLPKDIVQAFYESRTNTTPKYLCHAPFNNLYFNSLGHVANCWLTFHDPEIYTPEKTIAEIWGSDKFKKLRQHIKDFDLDYRCSTCKLNLLNKNFVNVLARAYDNEFELTDYPSLIEFELSNTCNLECTMCTGQLSSSIRKNREHLPPLPSPYGDKFVNELNEFIPHLKEARFNGGEPFLIKTYWSIWENIIRINRTLKVVIATNGTVLNERVKDFLKRGNFHLNISIDGLSRETYNNIRVNADIEQVLNNFAWFRDFCSANNRNLCVMVNPMRQNWWEMAQFVNFCNEHNVHIWYNTIEHPLDQAIWNLPSVELEKIYNTLSTAELKPNSRLSKNIYQYNINTFNNLVHNQIYNWLLAAKEREKNSTENSVLQAYTEKIVAYMDKHSNEYTDLDKSNVLEKINLLEQTFETEGLRKAFRNLIYTSSPSLITENLKSHPFEEAKKLLTRHLLDIGVH